ncbi:DUF6515 family protein [Chitinophaga solisilvae]|uniref:DUF6515 family protein n=1 Tax=Chitinophaga solisilvae TaxID=1233460 RepID=UPI00136CDC59|nr:DUF6515 family protein [Chitinophaga solisilvae]
MKNRSYMLFVLIGLLCTSTATGAYAQRLPHGGSGRVMSGGHYSAPGRYYSHGYRGPVFHGGYYRPGWYGPVYRPYFRTRVFFPPVGLYVSTLPYGYFPLGPAFGPVFYYQGTYYRSNDNNRGYNVVDPPLNAIVPNLPKDAAAIELNGNSYYEFNGTYYQEIMTDNGRRYQVVGKNGKIGDNTVAPQPYNNSAPDEQLMTSLPEGSRSVQLNGQQYFLSPDGMYYQEVKTSNGTGYKVVGKMDADE